MNLPTAFRRVAFVSSVAGALIACGYAASEHRAAQSLQTELRMVAESAAVANASCDDSSAYGTDSSGAVAEGEYAPVNDDVLPKVRQAARDFLQSAMPGAKTDGVFTLALRPGNLYVAGADVADGGKRRTVDMLVRLYTKKNGGQYWRAESLAPDRAAVLMDRISEDTAPADSSYDVDTGPADSSASE